MLNRIRQLPAVFWIGLFPVVCLLWLWADSTRYRSTWSHCTEWNELRSISAFQSSLVFRHTVASEKVAGIRLRFGHYDTLGRTGPFGWLRRYPIGGPGMEKTWFPAVIQSTSDDRHRNRDFNYLTHLVEVPFWLILTGYLPLWLAVAWWQWRRRRGRIAMMEPSPTDYGERQVEPRMNTDSHG